MIRILQCVCSEILERREFLHRLSSSRGFEEVDDVHVCIPHELRACTSAIRARSVRKKTHLLTLFDIIGNGRNVNDRAQVLPRSQVAICPVDEIELLGEGIVEIYAGDRQCCRALVPLKDPAESREIVVSGAVLVVCKA